MPPASSSATLTNASVANRCAAARASVASPRSASRDSASSSANGTSVPSHPPAPSRCRMSAARCRSPGAPGVAAPCPAQASPASIAAVRSNAAQRNGARSGAAAGRSRPKPRDPGAAANLPRTGYGSIRCSRRLATARRPGPARSCSRRCPPARPRPRRAPAAGLSRRCPSGAAQGAPAVRPRRPIGQIPDPQQSTRTRKFRLGRS